MTLSTTGLFNFSGSGYTFNSNSDEADFHVNCEQIYFGDEHCDTIRLGDLGRGEGDTTIQLYGDIVARNGDVSVTGDVSATGDVSINGDITGNSVTSPAFVVKDAGGSSENAMITYSASPDHSIEMDSALTVFGDVYIDDNCDLTVEGTIYCSNGVQNSDERIKENIVNVDANIEDIASTRIVTFNFKDKEERNLGTIAQDWQKIFPEAVKENKDGMLALDYSAISIASAVKAAREIVELKKKNEELEARLAALEAKLG